MYNFLEDEKKKFSEIGPAKEKRLSDASIFKLIIMFKVGSMDPKRTQIVCYLQKIRNRIDLRKIRTMDHTVNVKAVLR